jgi:hypothetical protein
VNQPALDAPMCPRHHCCRALSSLQLMLRDGESESQLCVHRGEQFARVAQARRLTDFPSVGRNELRSPIGAKLRSTRKANAKENRGTRVTALSPRAAWFGAEW